MIPYLDTKTVLFDLEERRRQAASHRLARSCKQSPRSKAIGQGGASVLDDPLTALVRQRQEELRSLADEIAHERRVHKDTRSLQRRPLHLRLVSFLFGPR